MSGTLQVSGIVISDHIFDLLDEMEQTAKVLRILRQTKGYTTLDWEEVRSRIDTQFETVFEDLGLNETEDEVLDEIEGEEEDAVEDDEWHEGFDDV